MLVEAIFVLEDAYSCTNSNDLLVAANNNNAFKHVFTISLCSFCEPMQRGLVLDFVGLQQPAD